MAKELEGKKEQSIHTPIPSHPIREFPHPFQSTGSRALPSALFAEEDVMEQDKFVVFESWLLGNGAKFPKLELRV